MGKKKDDPLTVEEQCEVSLELSKLMRIARIAGPGDLYDASTPSQTFGDVDRVIGNPISFEEAADADLSKSTWGLKFTHIEGFNEFLKNQSKDSNNVNSMEVVHDWRLPAIERTPAKFTSLAIYVYGEV